MKIILEQAFPSSTISIGSFSGYGGYRGQVDSDHLIDVLNKYQHLLDQYTDGAFLSFICVNPAQGTVNVKPGISKDVPFRYNDLIVIIDQKAYNLYYEVKIAIESGEGLDKLENILSSADSFTCPYYEGNDDWISVLDEIDGMDIESACKRLSEIGYYPIAKHTGRIFVEFMKGYVNFYESETGRFISKDEITVDDYCNNVIELAHECKNKHQFIDELADFIHSIARDAYARNVNQQD